MAAWLENYPCCPLFSARDSRPQIREGLKRLADIGMLKRHQLSRQPEANKIWHFTLIFPRTPMSQEILEDFRQRWSQARPTPAKPNFAVHTPPSFLGRDQDTQELWQRYLAGERLILLYGAAGVGKTALARHVVQRFEHIIELVPSTDPMLEFPLPAWLAFQVQHWGETPQREWPLLLEQWRYCLQQRACGVLVDGVERIL